MGRVIGGHDVFSSSPANDAAISTAGGVVTLAAKLEFFLRPADFLSCASSRALPQIRLLVWGAR